MASSTTKTFEQIGIPEWLSQQLRDKNKPFKFTSPLPVQAAVIPFAGRAFSSWMLHCDVGLSAPTGSGKTLCYCLPMIKAIADQKERFRGGLPDRHIRGVIVVPTAILAEQVCDVLQALLSVSVSASSSSAPVTSNNLLVGTLFRGTDDGNHLVTRKSIAASSASTASRYYGTVDVLIATPQKLCTWIERLADEDEEEQLERSLLLLGKSNNNNSAAASRLTSSSPSSHVAASTSKLVDVFGRTQVVVLDEADDLLATSGYFTSMAGRIVDAIQSAVTHTGETVLHKMLCSATLTARISKVSDVKLQNAKYFSLDASGQEVNNNATTTTTSLTNSNGNQMIVRQKFPLPSSLSEHLVIVRDDSKRHVTLLNTVRFALEELQKNALASKTVSQDGKAKKKNDIGGNDDDDNDDDDDEHEGVARENSEVLTKKSDAVPSWRSTGSSVIVFCQTAEIARVMGHFLAFAGVDALELTTLTSDAERRQAALAVAAAKSSEQKVVVASDALMRGIDLPGVGAVIMYDPPTTLQQYIHRVGRTARAGAVGHSYVLLSKNGPSGTEEDGQVAHFRSFDSALLRNGKVSNLVKLRELNDEEVVRADDLLRKTRNKLHGVVEPQQQNARQQQGDDKKHERRRNRN